MQDLLKFIVKYSNLLVFLALEVVAFLLLLSNNTYPKSTALSTANKVVARQNAMVDDVTSYFYLRAENEDLHRENAELRTRLEQLNGITEDSLTEEAASYLEHSIQYIPARVIETDSRSSHNYLTINRGKLSGIRAGMGVRNSDGIVGIVSTVGEHYSIVVPIIHTSSRTSCMFQRNGYMGTLHWDGDDYRYADLEDIALHVDVEEGDTLVTSGLSTAYPRGIPVGIVDKCTLEDGDSYFTIRIRLTTDFRHLGYVQVVDDRSVEEIRALKNGLD